MTRIPRRWRARAADRETWPGTIENICNPRQSITLFVRRAHPLVFQDDLVQAALLPVLVEELLALVGRLAADLARQRRPVPAVRPQLGLHGLDLPVGPGGLEAALVPLGVRAVGGGGLAGRVGRAAARRRVGAAAHVDDLARDALEARLTTLLRARRDLCKWREGAIMRRNVGCRTTLLCK